MSTALHNTRLSARGLSLTELAFVMAILSASFLGILSTMDFMANGMHSETVYAEQNTRTTGTLYDVVAELRDATAYSPNFFLEVNPEKPPRITFDKVDTVDSSGNMVWGNKITYRLERVSNAASAAFESDHAGITQGRIVREETGPKKGDPTVLSVIEDSVPYRFTKDGSPAWGFNVSRDGCALSITISRFGDTGSKSIEAQKNGTEAAQQVQAPAPTGNSSTPTATTVQGSIVITTVNGVYFLKNPQVVIPAQ